MPLEIMMESLTASEIAQILQNDLTRISAVLKTPKPRDFSNLLGSVTPRQLEDKLLAIMDLSKSIDNHSEQHEAERGLRHYTALVKRHLNEMWPQQNTRESEALPNVNAS